ncbi:MAG: amidohydrolase family protein, partial [Sphingomonadaceae bacterium]
MKLSRFTIALAATAAFTLPAFAQTPAKPVTALVGGNVVAIDGGTPITDATVLIEGERIVQIGPSASVAVPAGAKVVPMQG